MYRAPTLNESKRIRRETRNKLLLFCIHRSNPTNKSILYISSFIWIIIIIIQIEASVLLWLRQWPPVCISAALSNILFFPKPFFSYILSEIERRKKNACTQWRVCPRLLVGFQQQNIFYPEIGIGILDYSRRSAYSSSLHAAKLVFFFVHWSETNLYTQYKSIPSSSSSSSFFFFFCVASCSKIEV